MVRMWLAKMVFKLLMLIGMLLPGCIAAAAKLSVHAGSQATRMPMSDFMKSPVHRVTPESLYGVKQKPSEPASPGVPEMSIAAFWKTLHEPSRDAEAFIDPVVHDDASASVASEPLVVDAAGRTDVSHRGLDEFAAVPADTESAMPATSLAGRTPLERLREVAGEAVPRFRAAVNKKMKAATKAATDVRERAQDYVSDKFTEATDEAVGVDNMLGIDADTLVGSLEQKAKELVEGKLVDRAVSKAKGVIIKKAAYHAASAAEKELMGTDSSPMVDGIAKAGKHIASLGKGLKEEAHGLAKDLGVERQAKKRW